MEYWFLIYFILPITMIIISVFIFDFSKRDLNLTSIILILIIAISTFIIILSENLFCIFLCLEIQTFSAIILIAENRSSFKSVEAGLKYFILGEVSSGLFLLGLYFIYSSTFELNIPQLIIEQNIKGFQVVIWGKLFILISLIFKLGGSPLHYWLIDVYESLSWENLIIIAVLPKISYITCIVKIIPLTEVLIIIGIISIIFGTLGAFNQTKIKRLFAYSAVSHTGFYLLILTSPLVLGIEISYFYFMVYSFTFLILLITCYIMKIKPFIIQIAEFKNKIPTLIFITFTILILSLAGIPPFAGFLIKWFLLWELVTNHYYWSGFFIIFFSILIISFYLNLIKILWFQNHSKLLYWTKTLEKRNKPFYHHPVLITYLSFGLFVTIFLIYSFEIIIKFLELNIW